MNVAVGEKLNPGASAGIKPSFCTLQFTREPGASRLAVRLQRPTVVAEVSFILAVAKFAYPSFTVSGGASEELSSTAPGPRVQGLVPHA